MILECARIVREWLEHPNYGVNGVLPLVPRDIADPVPPSIVAFEDEVTSPRAAVGRPAITMPALQVDVLGIDVLENQVVTDQGDGNVVVRVRYAASRANAADAKRDGSYTIRAVAWSLRILYRQAFEAARTRNSIRLRPARQGQLTIRPYYEELEDRLITGVCLAPYDFRDFATLP